MIRRISGTLIERDLGTAVIDVGGIGYLVFVTHRVTLTEGGKLTLHTYHAVREDASDLYGFETKEELVMFEHLISLSGIGPKSALNILTHADVSLLREATLSGDAEYLSKLSGLGKKSAEKIVVGLKDKIGSSAELQTTSKDSDVIDALLSLGYSQHEARTAIQNLTEKSLGTNERLKAALQSLGKK